MLQENEIRALIALLDDKDDEVFDHVSEKLFSLGPAVIGQLENAYAEAPDPLMQERIENLIHKIQLDGIEKDLVEWSNHDSDNLLRGILIVTRHQYPDLDEEKVMKAIIRMKKDIWIGLNHYLSPLEQMNVINQTLFAHYQFQGMQSEQKEIRYAYINNLIDTFKGTHFTIGLLYLSLCQQLEIPVYGVRLSTHFILARTKDFITDFSDRGKIKNEILFYINPYNKGLAFSDREINIYLKKMETDIREEYYLPASNKAVLKEYIQYLIRLYTKPEEEYKVDDLIRLANLLGEE